MTSINLNQTQLQKENISQNMPSPPTSSSLHILPLLLLLLLPSITSSIPLQKRNGIFNLHPLDPLPTSLPCIKYNPIDCRDFELYPVPTSNIDAYMIPGGPSNLDPRVHESAYGIFYMMGNRNPSELVTVAHSTFDEKTGALYARIYDNAWAWSNTKEGRELYETTRNVALNYRMTHDPVTNISHVTAVYHFPLGVSLTVNPNFLNYTIIQRTMRIFSFDGRVCGLRKCIPIIRIVRADGSRTKYYETFLGRINAGKGAWPGFSNDTHLGDTVLLARVVGSRT
ncbi:hypothetical protein BC829DRAFT_486380 [Chytridium lagenaria]|nr:hypothetical protein BC829DRAFT_486380 [Chytridium lagenaria]